MSNERLLDPVVQLLAQAEAILVLAEAEDWMELGEQMNDYLHKVSLLDDQAYLKSLKDAGLALSAQGLILQIHGVNQKVDELAQDSHQKIASELRQMIQSNKAMDAYSR